MNVCEGGKGSMVGTIEQRIRYDTMQAERNVTGNQSKEMILTLEVGLQQII